MAIKKYGAVVNDKEKEAIKKECAILSKLKHPNIIYLFGYCYDPFIIVMELMPKGDLYKFLENTPNIPPILKY